MNKGSVWWIIIYNWIVCFVYFFTDAYIEGQTNYGDNVEDEWFIVFLLIQLCKLDPNLVIQLEDSDGDFIAIEAAEYLPKWMNPTTSVNRVFISQGKVHIIHKKKEPLPHGTPSIKDAVDVVRNTRYDTLASKEIQAAIDAKVKNFPGSIKKHQHRAHCFVPAAVAEILNADPVLISSAIRSFVYRDSSDMKACRVMKYFPPENRVMRNVTMTRCLYAQLMSQKYSPDPKIGWDIPPANSKHFKSYDLGMKIACGFEILVTSLGDSHCNSNGKSSNLTSHFPQSTAAASSFSERKTPSSHSTDADVKGENIDEDKSWQKFIRVLYANGYFEGLVKGSREYNHKLEKAKSYFVNRILPATSEDITATFYSNSGKRVLNLLKNVDVDFEKLKKEECKLEREDSDRWMRMAPEDLDAYLADKFLNSATNPAFAELSHSIPKAINKFVECESSLYGVEVPPVPPRSLKPSRMSMSSSNSSRSNSGSSSGDSRKQKTSEINGTAAGEKSKELPFCQSGSKNDKKSCELRKSELLAQSSTFKIEKSRASDKSDHENAGFDADNFLNALRSVLSLKVPSDPEESSDEMSDYSDECNSDIETPDSSDDEAEEMTFLRNQRRNNQNNNNNNNNHNKHNNNSSSTPSSASSGPRAGDKCHSSSGLQSMKMKSYFKQMDKELASTAVGRTFEKNKPPLAQMEDDDEDDEDDDDDDPVDADYTALKNILESFKSQEGLPGPSSTLLNSMGVFLPRDEGGK